MFYKLLIRVFLILFIYSCDMDFYDTNKSKDTEKYVAKPYDIYIKGFDLENFSQKNKTWTLDGEEGFFYEDKNMFQVTNVIIKIYDDSKETTITANQGLFYKKTRDMDLMGNVFISTSDETKLYSEKIKWINSNEKFYSDEYVQVVNRSGSKLSGYGVEADKNLNKVIFKNNVRGNITDRDLEKK